MKEKDNVTLRDIEDYLKNVFKHAIHFTAKDISNFSAEEYNDRVSDALDMLFSDGRYSVTTEFFIERWDIPEFEEAMNDIRLISQLTPALRTKLKFLRDVMEVGRPLFHRQAPDLSLPLFGFKNCEVSVKNRELMDYLSSATHLHLAAMIAFALKEKIADEYSTTNTIVVKELGYPATYLEKCNRCKSDEELKEHLDEMINLFYDIDNHLELGKRMGLTARGLYIYDIIDTFICNRYFYNQVDAAKEFDQWLTDNWTGWAEAEEDIVKQQKMVVEAYENVLNKHDVSNMPDRSSLLYLFYDLLGYSDIPDDYCDDDEGFDLSDDDIDD